MIKIYEPSIIAQAIETRFNQQTRRWLKIKKQLLNPTGESKAIKIMPYKGML